MSPSVVARVEKRLGELRVHHAEGTRTSVMTHVAWAPPRWAAAARRTLAGLDELHPSRTILLFPEPGKADAIGVDVDLKCFTIAGSVREVCSEVIQLRLGGARSHVPGSIVQPLLITDLPTFCRWRGLPPWGKPELEQLVDVCDRLVVDSSEWRGLPGAYTKLCTLFDRIAVSDIAWGRSVGWRGRIAALWPEVKVGEVAFRNGAESRRVPARGLAPRPAEASGEAFPPLCRRARAGGDRRRARRVATRCDAERERPALGRARRLRPRRDLRSGRQRSPLTSRTPFQDVDSS